MPTIEFSRNHKRKIEKTKSRLEIDFIILGKLFHKNYMTLKPGEKKTISGLALPFCLWVQTLVKALKIAVI